jgi:transcriptional regulator
MTGQALKGHLDLLLLAVLAEGPNHGYAVIEALCRRSDDVFDLPEGTVYPALHRLEQSGQLTSTWTVAQGRRRRIYELTPAGRAALVEEQSRWTHFSQAVNRVAGVAPWPTTI